jgi:SH3 domain protein
MAIAHGPAAQPSGRLSDAAKKGSPKKGLTDGSVSSKMYSHNQADTERIIMRLPIALMAVMTLAGLLLVDTHAAGTTYVTDVLRLTLRSRPSAGAEIVGVIQSGQNLEVVSEIEKWAQVKIPDGREGWVLSRYLTDEETAERKLNRLRQQFESQKEELEALRSEAAELKKQNQLLQTELRQKSRQAEEATEAYDQLKKESAAYLKLKAEHQSTLKKATEQSSQIIGMEKELTRLETQRLVRWFLAGAGVLLLGFVIGFSAKRQRRKYLA